MSRDNGIFFQGTTFPHESWAELLSVFDATAYATDDFDREHCVTHNWYITTKDDRTVHIDLVRLEPNRQIRPDGYDWKVGIHGHSGSPDWFLYSIPMLAAARLNNTIFWDPHPPNGFVTCDLDGIIKRALEVVPRRVDPQELIKHGYIVDRSLWPAAEERRTIPVPSLAARNAAADFCKEMGADLYTEVETNNDIDTKRQSTLASLVRGILNQFLKATRR